MRRIEQDPEEIREEEEAIARHATPSHEQITEEIDVEAIREALGDKACRSLRPAEHILGEYGEVHPHRAGYGEFYPLDVLRGMQAEIEARQRPPDNEWES